MKPNGKTDLAPAVEIVKRNGPGRDLCIKILQELQAAYGFLPVEAIEYMADNTDTPLTEIYGAATFYEQFRFTPTGKNLIRVCHGTACHVNGADRIDNAISDYLGIKDGETTPDRLFTLQTVACLGCCSLSPVMMINETVYGRLTPDETRAILKRYRREAAAGGENKQAVPGKDVCVNASYIA